MVTKKRKRSELILLLQKSYLKGAIEFHHEYACRRYHGGDDCSCGAQTAQEALKELISYQPPKHLP